MRKERSLTRPGGGCTMLCAGMVATDKPQKLLSICDIRKSKEEKDSMYMGYIEKDKVLHKESG